MKVKYAVRVYRDIEQQFRWRVVSKANGSNIANGGEGYDRIGSVMDMVYALFGLEIGEGSVELQFETRPVAHAGAKWISKHWSGAKFTILEE